MGFRLRRWLSCPRILILIPTILIASTYFSSNLSDPSEKEIALKYLADKHLKRVKRQEIDYDGINENVDDRFEQNVIDSEDEADTFLEDQDLDVNNDNDVDNKEQYITVLPRGVQKEMKNMPPGEQKAVKEQYIQNLKARSSTTTSKTTSTTTTPNIDEVLPEILKKVWPQDYEYHPWDGVYHDDEPGGLGEPFIIDREKLIDVEKEEYDEGFKNNGYNDYASRRISLHRSLKDPRHELCNEVNYLDKLPTASVVIIFHNEGWSVLLRTVHSVIERTPKHLLKEVILVDDFSNMEHLHKPLEEYIANFGNVFITRTPRRNGLIKARLQGASVAKGEVIIFLDSHCEAMPGWIEPLLDPIGRNMSTVVTPVINTIDLNNFKLLGMGPDNTAVGGFDWSLTFTWHFPSKELDNRKKIVDPLRSPTMAGGLFAISREYFYYIGSYDEEMDIWGAENLEMSFRIWMCGGTLVTVPCSHVGHVFRERSPYKWRTGKNVVQFNTIRMAEVWLDEYKHFYYERFKWKLGDYGDISSRVKLRERLQCKSFDWFIKNVYPDRFIPPDAIAHGELRNGKANQCMDFAANYATRNKPVITWPCHGQGGNQYFLLTKSGELRRDDFCIQPSRDQKNITQDDCHGPDRGQDWVYGEDKTLKLKNTDFCIELAEDDKGLTLGVCKPGKSSQTWYIKMGSPEWPKPPPNLE